MDFSSLLVGLAIGTVIGALAAWLIARARTPALREERARLMAQLDAERRAAADRTTLLERAEVTLRDAFASLSADALRQNNESFLALAQVKLGELQHSAASDLELRQRAVDDLVRPLKEALARVDGKLQEVEKERLTSYAGLLEQVRAMARASQSLQSETGKLVKALRAPHVRGRWGEIQLRRVVEMAGMLDYCDFEEQASVEGENGRLRPDLVVRLPGNKTVIVDAKAPLAAYLDAVEGTDDETERELLLKEHARQVRDHMVSLGSKTYWNQFQPAPDFVVMFLPGETFFSAACQQDPSLIEFGVGQQVIPASPTTLIALLRAIAYGWRQEQIAQNAVEISRMGRELYERLSKLAEYFAAVGTHLDRATRAYNDAAGNFEKRVLVSARRMKEKGVTVAEDIPEVTAIERVPKTSLFAAD